MKVFVCVDDTLGIAFNHRRQSRDRILNEDVVKTADTRLFCTPYSEELLRAHPRLAVTHTPLLDAGRDDYVFAEMLALAEYSDKIDTLILYHWNRKYPSDMHLDLSLDTFRLVSKEEFVGYSHEKITKEVYTR